MSIILAVSNQKGGVAKTTSCFSTGACLAEAGYRTLVIDLDPQAHLTMAAGLNPDELPLTVVDLLENPREHHQNDALFHPTSMEGLDILPADLRLAQLERHLSDTPRYEFLLKDALAPYSSKNARGRTASPGYDFMLIDCPPSMGTMTLVALTAARAALVPVQCEFFASRGLLRLLDVIQAVQTHTNPGLQYMIFATLFDTRNSISRRVLEELRSHFGTLMLDTVIRMDTRLRESPMAGEPVIQYAPRTRSSEEYRALAAEVIQRTKP